MSQYSSSKLAKIERNYPKAEIGMGMLALLSQSFEENCFIRSGQFQNQTLSWNPHQKRTQSLVPFRDRCWGSMAIMPEVPSAFVWGERIYYYSDNYHDLLTF